MRCAFLLLLLLAFSDGLFQREMFSNRSFPCQSARNNNAFNNFTRKHILTTSLSSRQTRAWADYLMAKRLCGREPLQSFLRKDDTDSVIRICNGRGVRYRQNMCISKRSFTVYLVRSVLTDTRCEIQSIDKENSYVIVACEVIENRCLPVHYQGQNNSRPSRSGLICKPPEAQHRRWSMMN